MEKQVLPILWPRLPDKSLRRSSGLQPHDRLPYDRFLRLRSIQRPVDPQYALSPLEKRDRKIWTCPLSQEKYEETCPIEACPANVGKTGCESGCIHNYLNKTEISVYDYAFAHRITVKTARQRLAEGEDQIQFVFFCQEILNRVRERHIRQITCPVCGVFRSTKGPCLNKAQCQTRVSIGSKIISASPLNVPETPLERRDVFMLLRSKDEIVKLMEARNNELTSAKPRYFHDVLGVSPEFVNELHDLRTLV